MTAKTSDEILQRLEEEGKKEGFDPKFLELYRRILRTQALLEPRISKTKPSLNIEATNKRLELGLPLVSFEELALDWPLLEEVFNEVIAIFADFPEFFGEIPQSLKEALTAKLTNETVKAWFEEAKLPDTIVDDKVTKHLLETIIHTALRPFLASQAKTLLNFVKPELWRRRYCPICGGSPDFAFLEKEVGARWLLCSRCDAEWLFQRLECPYCGNNDQNTLAYFTDDGGRYRLYVCEKCHTYIKAVDLRHTEAEVLLPLERIMTLDIDRQGQEKGYQPGHSR